MDFLNYVFGKTATFLTESVVLGYNISELIILGLAGSLVIGLFVHKSGG